MDTIKKKILIVEDEETLARAIREKLEEYEFDIDIAIDGDEALEKINHDRPNLVLLDLMLPKLSGEKVLEEMNKNGLIKKIPVIVLTAKSEDANLNNCIDVLGASDYLIKPYSSLDKVIKTIKKYI